jgi:hypothetical protein
MSILTTHGTGILGSPATLDCITIPVQMFPETGDQPIEGAFRNPPPLPLVSDWFLQKPPDAQVDELPSIAILSPVDECERIAPQCTTRTWKHGSITTSLVKTPGNQAKPAR